MSKIETSAELVERAVDTTQSEFSPAEMKELRKLIHVLEFFRVESAKDLVLSICDGSIIPDDLEDIM